MTLQIKPTNGGAAVDATAQNIADIRSALGVEDVASSAAFIALRDSTETSLGSLQTAVDGKSPILTFTGAGVTKVGNTVNIPGGGGATESLGALMDGQSTLLLPTNSGWSLIGNDTFVSAGSGNSTSGQGITPPPTNNQWNSRFRAKQNGAASAGAAHAARVSNASRMRFASDNSATMGFKWVVTFAPADAMTTTHNFVGLISAAPAVNTHPSAYASTRFGLQCAGDDTNRWWKLVSGTSLIKDLGSSFPCDGNETNPIQFEVESIPNPTGTRILKWKITHLVSGATDSGTITDGTNVPSGTWDINAIMLRDNNGSTTAVAAFTSRGWSFGGFRSLVVPTVVTGGGEGGGGTPVTDSSVPREVAASGPLLGTDVNCVIRTNSASAIQLTLPSLETLGATAGKATITVYVKGAGVTTIVPQNGVTAPGGTPPSGVQGTFVTLVHNGENWVYPA